MARAHAPPAAPGITLLLPGLLGPAGVAREGPEAVRALVADLDLGALDRLLARAGGDLAPDAEASVEAPAFRAFGYGAPPGDADWPVAALTALVDCEAGGRGCWLRADPVHLHADPGDLILHDSEDLEIPDDEAAALARSVNEAFGPGGPRLRAAHPRRWYVALDRPPRLRTTPPSLAAGAGIFGTMPRGPDAPQWRRRMNEAQMALHASAVNAERERRGALPINSIWPWGGGDLPPAAEPPLVRAFGDDALVRGLARRAGLGCEALPTGARAWLASAPRPGTHLVACAALHRAARRGDLAAWRDGIARLGREWAEPLLDALDRGRLARVSILDERGHRFTATRWGRLRWWRREGLAARIAAASPRR